MANPADSHRSKPKTRGGRHGASIGDNIFKVVVEFGRVLFARLAHFLDNFGQENPAHAHSDNGQRKCPDTMWSMRKRQRAAALQDALRGMLHLQKSDRSWSAALCRFLLRADLAYLLNRSG